MAQASDVQQSASLVFVSCYTRFDNLAHGPRGTQAKHGIYTFKLDPIDGQMLLLSVTQTPIMNPAFSRFHPERSVLYTVTESVAENGEITTWGINRSSGALKKLSSYDAGGTSTCYITIDKEINNMLVVNYWDSTLGVFGLNKATGEVTERRSMYDPNFGKPMKARADKHVNHSDNDEETQKERRADPHSHALILDPFYGEIAYVPDLGMDLIRQFRYDKKSGSLTAVGTMASGPPGRTALGPRYVEFHPTMPVAYVINELSSEVSVFEFQHEVAQDIIAGKATDKPTLELVQTIRTLPGGFPGSMNTCGRITVHPYGQFVLASNRGHNSITVFRVNQSERKEEGLGKGHLALADCMHTRGATPRHFQFDRSGQWLICANQDSDSIAIFHLNLATGKLTFTGHTYSVPSPNFVCAIPASHPLSYTPPIRSASKL
eukprot:TRINITY_DN9670_c0_g1_i1.p1 TRINITY_DN9670_c0_g1~~TRINITY_DN9670_c0_g1_i1.p1  ORF type:complete len:434 (-),score=92.04 TRINITY_DN9670_c0_g1_i1:156-1457(-)